MSESAPTLTLTPIGIVHSPWRDKQSAPRQPSEARDVTGQIEVYPRAELLDALADLDAWSHIWVVFWFHLNDGFLPKVLPPRSSKKRGLFSTRAPYRPNPIGLSVLRLDRVEGSTLHVRDLDIVDQTPVLDIKPYVAYVDAVSGANAGWLETTGDPPAPELAASPAPAGPAFHVDFDAHANEQLDWLVPRCAFDLRAAVLGVLRAGPAPHAYRRIRAFDGYSVLGVKDFRVHFRVAGPHIVVFRIATGYRARVLADPHAEAREQTPLAVHRELVARFG
ncbi:MAG: tRNA (N6-threonylcarbamoyladenosine(37)-N6)-methyltransferase TrmO [Polyangiales bacterium]